MTRTHRRPLALALTLTLAACAPVDDAPATADEALTLANPGITPVQLARPTITALTPTSGLVGQRIVIRGTSLDRARTGRFTLPGNLGYSVTFAAPGGLRALATAVTLRSASELEVTVPAQAVTGSVQLVDGLGPLATSPTAFTVVVPPPPPPPTVLRVVNNSQYTLGAFALNGQLVVDCATAIAPGASRDFRVMPGDTVGEGILGWCVNGRAESIAPTALGARVTVPAGATWTFNYDRVTLGDLMTNWGNASGQFSTGLFVGNDGNFHENSFYFDRVGGWRGVQDGAQWGAGRLTAVSWPTLARCVDFSLGPGSEVARFCVPFAGFVFNGLAHGRV